MDESTAEEFKGFADVPSDKTHRNVPRTLLHRQTGFRQRHNGVPIEFQWAAEDKLVLKDHEEMKCQLPGVPTRSTFLMVFSPDGKRVASTHGNHNIYVTDLTSGKNINTLTGHPRTPWCIAFHPSSNQILASGCLGGQVRVWDLHGGSEIWITKSQTVIASIAFHPTERMLVIATYNELYFWDWSQPEPYAKCHTSNEKEKVRYVSFDPLGYKLITGISNAPAVVSQWDRVGPPTTAASACPVQAAAAAAGLPHDPDQRRITICYRSLVEQYEQLVQRYYDLTRSRATPTMDRGTDPMDVDLSGLSNERPRHSGQRTGSGSRGASGSRTESGSRSGTPASSRSHAGTRIPTGSALRTSTATETRSTTRTSTATETGSATITSAARETGSATRTSTATETGLATAADSEPGLGARIGQRIGTGVPFYGGWLHRMNMNRPGATGHSHAEGKKTTSTGTNLSTSAIGMNSSTIGANSTAIGANSTTIGASSNTIGANSSSIGANSVTIGGISFTSETNSSITGTRSPTIGANSFTIRTRASAAGASTPPLATSSPPHPSSSPPIPTCTCPFPREITSDIAAPICHCSPSPGTTPLTSSLAEPGSDQSRGRSAPRDASVGRRNFVRLLREHQRLTRTPSASPDGAAHIRTYDVSRAGPVEPSFSAAPAPTEPARSPERPRRFFFSRRSAFQPQAPRLAEGGVFDGAAEEAPAQRAAQRAVQAARLAQQQRFAQSSAERGHAILGEVYGEALAGRAPAREATDVGVRYGIQLLSRHIDNMQRLCRARLEILQLQQIRRMWEDLQLQIRSLHVASRGAQPPSNQRRPPAAEPAPKMSSYVVAESRARHDLYRYLSYRAVQPSRPARSARRSAEQRRSVAWRHYSGRRPGQETPSFRHRAAAATAAAAACTTTESSTQASADDEAAAGNSASAAAANPASTAGASNGAARGVKRKYGETEPEGPGEGRASTGRAPVASEGRAPASRAPVSHAPEARVTREAQPTAGQGRTTTQSLRSMIARLETLVRQQRDQRERAAAMAPALDIPELPLPSPERAAISAEQRLASALQHEEYESGRLYRSTLDRHSHPEEWELTRESTRLRARQVLSLMVESLTQFFEENGLSHNTPHAVLDDQIYNLFILLQLALELTDLLLAQLASTRRELEHQWVHRLRSPVALEASETSPFRDDATGGRPMARRGRTLAARRPLFHPRAARDETGSARTAGSLPPVADPEPTPPLSSFRSLFSHDRHVLLRPPRPFSPSVYGPLDVETPGERRSREGEGTRRYLRINAERFRADMFHAEALQAEAFRVQTPAERRDDEREFMVQVRRYQNAGPTVPAVRVNDVPVDPSTMEQPRPGPPSPPPPFPPLGRGRQAATVRFAEADGEGGPWRPQRFLHPRYRLETPLHDAPYEVAGGGDGFNILRVMGPAFATEHVVLADSPVMPNHRIQAWDFTRLYIPDITDVEKNVVAAECKIHNDASVDVSSDGKMLVTLLPSGRLSMTTMLGIYSLHWETLGQCLYTTRFDQNAVSVSLSPVSRHLLVGLASRRVGAIMTDLHTMAQIFRLDKAAGGSGTNVGARGRLCHLRDIEQGREQPFMSINCIRWAPVAGQGLVFGTNNGQLKVLR